MRDARSPGQGLPTTRLAFGVCRGTTSHVGSSFLTRSCFGKESSCSPTTCSHDTTSLCLLQLLRYRFFFLPIICVLFRVLVLTDLFGNRGNQGREGRVVFQKPWLMSSHHRLMLSPKVIGGELQDRLIPVPYSKSSTDQAVRVFEMLEPSLFSCTPCLLRRPPPELDSVAALWFSVA